MGRGERAPTAHASAQERQCRLARRFARGRAVPPEPPPARRRPRRPGSVPRPRPPAVVAADHRREVVRGGSHAQPGPRGQRGGAPGRDRRPQRHRAGHQRPRARALALAGDRHRRPLHHRQGRRIDRPDPGAGRALGQERPLQPLRAGAGRHQCVGQHGAVLTDAPGGLSRRQRPDRHPAHVPPGGDHGDPRARVSRGHHVAGAGRQSQGGLLAGQPGRAVGHRRAVRDLPAGSQREPGPLGERRRHRGGHAVAPGPADRRHRGPQHRHRSPASGAERPAGPDPPGPQDPRRR